LAIAPGTQFGPYLILSSLGSGGMGEVYKARDPRLNRLVAIKVLPASMMGDPAALARFEREARILAGLSHPNIVAIHDVGTAEETPFVVTELLEGETLSSLLIKGVVPQVRAVAITLQIAKGLVAAHDKGIIHRDLKPSNVIVGKGDHAKLLDFGLAKDLKLDLEGSATDAMALPGHTFKGTLLGTVGYMAPEQVRGEGADARSDLFALGILLLEMLTGKQAFTGDSAVEVLHAILREDPLEGRELPVLLRPVIERLLAKDPADRFQTAKDLVFVLVGMGSSASTLPSVGEVRQGRPFKPSWGLITLSCLLGLAGVGWGLLHQHAAPPPLIWTQITTRPGLITAARFSPDGLALAYSAAGSDGCNAIFTLGEGEPYPRATSQNGKVLALDRGGEIYFAGQGQQAINPGAGVSGILLRWKGEGTSPRLCIENIQEGDLGPDGQHLAVIRFQDQMTSGSQTVATLECPPGKVLVQSKLWMTCLRWSPDGKSIAYIQHLGDDWSGQVVVVDLEGHQRFQSSKLDAVCSLAWAPDGENIVFTTGYGFGRPTTIAAIDLRGRTRELLSSGEDLFLMDIDPKGRMLLSSTRQISRSMIERDGQFVELILPFRGRFSILSPDGTKASFLAIESDLATVIYIRDLVTKDLIRLTPGSLPLAFSPDNAWLLIDKSQDQNQKWRSLALVSLGSGGEVPLNVQGLLECSRGLLPDRDHPIVRARLLDGTFAWFLLDPQRPPKRIASTVDMPFWCEIVATDSTSLWGFDLKRGLVRGSLKDTPWTPIGGALADRVPLAWDPLTKELLVVRRQQYLETDPQNPPKGPFDIERMNPITLRIRPDRTLKFPSSDSTLYDQRLASGTALVGSTEFRGHLFVVDGLLSPARK